MHGSKSRKLSKKHNKKVFKTKNKYSEEQPVNKKAIFNRYKDKQKVEELLSKKRKLENAYCEESLSGSEDEENPIEQLRSCFGLVRRIEEVLSSDDDSDNVDDLVEEDLLEDEECSSNEESEQEESENETITEENEPTNNEKDPFHRHFQHLLSNSLLLAISSKPVYSTNSTLNWPELGEIMMTIPQPIESKHVKKPALLLEEDLIFTLHGKPPELIKSINFDEIFIHTRLRSKIGTANKENLVRNEVDNELFTPIQKELFSIVNNYQDLYYPECKWNTQEEIRFVYCLHVANHVTKKISIITANDTKLGENKLKEVPDECRDQGLIRPSVLIVAPFRSSALKIVNNLRSIIFGEKGELGNGQRFQEEYGGETLQLPKAKPKPEDYELLFSGNTDDNFKLGIAVTKKTLKLYTDFYSSDIIIASPLGLRTLIGAEGEKERDYDFLNSLEVVIMDQTDVLIMQNWEHVLHIFQHMHLQPQTSRNTDFSRVRSWAINGWAKYYRQTLIFSSINVPEISSILNNSCSNYAGKAKIWNPTDKGSIRQVVLAVPQLFYRYKAEDPLSAVDKRFECLIKEILPRQNDPLMGHTLIYVPSYFDYVRIRNHFKKDDISFVQICEYSKDNKVARARDMFFHSEARILLYSERAHFFHRRRVKGIRHIIFYQPPTLPHFYSEMINFMQEANQNKYGGSSCNMSVTTIYCKYDMTRLVALVGTDRATNMLNSEQNSHMLVTGQ